MPLVGARFYLIAVRLTSATVSQTVEYLPVKITTNYCHIYRGYPKEGIVLYAEKMRDKLRDVYRPEFLAPFNRVRIKDSTEFIAPVAPADSGKREKQQKTGLCPNEKRITYRVQQSFARYEEEKIPAISLAKAPETLAAKARGILPMVSMDTLRDNSPRWCLNPTV